MSYVPSYPPRASARLLLARMSHSRGSVGGYRLRAIHHPSLAQGRLNHEIGRIAILLDLFRRHDNGIDRCRARKAPVNLLGHSIAIELAALDDQEIDVTVGSHLTSCIRTEKDDFLRIRGFDDALHNVSQDLLIWSSGFSRAAFRLHANFSAGIDLVAIDRKPANRTRQGKIVKFSSAPIVYRKANGCLLGGTKGIHLTSWHVCPGKPIRSVSWDAPIGQPTGGHFGRGFAQSFRVTSSGNLRASGSPQFEREFQTRFS
jgi:hypothetical protein